MAETPVTTDHRYCAQVMLEDLKDAPGIVAAHLDTGSDTLTVDYDPEIIHLQRVSDIAEKVGERVLDNYGVCGIRAGGVYCGECITRFEGRPLGAAADVPAARVQSADGVLSLTLAPPGSSPPRTETHTRRLQGHFEQESAGSRLFRADVLEPALVVVTLVALLAGVAARSLGAAAWIETVFAVIAYVAGGYFGLVKGLQSLRELEINVDILMLLAAGGAAIIGSWPEGATLLFLFSLSNVLQNYALGRSRQAIRKLLDLRPATAHVMRGGEEVEVLVETLAVGETVLIRPGENIPVDGVVTSGESLVDQASITGESVPVNKAAGDQVFAGTVNQHGALEVEVSKLAQDTTLAKIIQLVEDAQEEKAPTQRFLDRFEQYYAMAVIAGVALIIAVPVLVFGQPFEPTFYRGMVLLVVASPCALVISTPASILSAIADGARKGILFKGGAHLENAAMVKVVAFDKTGTLTVGKPRVTDVIPGDGFTESDVLALAAAVEARSEHPLAEACVVEAESRELDLPAASDFQSHPGMGVRASVNGHTVLVGSRRMMEREGITVSGVFEEHIRRLEGEGKTVLLVHNSTCIGAIGVADRVRPQAAETVKALKQAGVEHIAMLTGDNERVANSIAQELGVDEVHAALMPDDKVTVVKQLRERYGAVAMVGDGVNDAPALATASIGIAMGAAGTDVALETADVVLMADDLTKLPYVLRLSKKARRIVWQNIAFSLAVIVLLVLGTFGVFGETLPLPLGVVGHEGSTVLVVLNGLRLLAFGAGE